MTKLRELETLDMFSHITKEEFSYSFNKNNRKGKIYMGYRFISDEFDERVFRYTFSHPSNGNELSQLIFQLELLRDKERTVGDINSLNIIDLRVSALNEFSIVLFGKNQRILDYIKKYGAILTDEENMELYENLHDYLMDKEEKNSYYFGICSPEYTSEMEELDRRLKNRVKLEGAE